LNTQLPITLPTAMSRSPLRLAMIDAATSGSDVPAATIVRPMTTTLTPIVRANWTAAETIACEPATSSTSPTPINAI